VVSIEMMNDERIICRAHQFSQDSEYMADWLMSVLKYLMMQERPPLRSSGQSSWLQIWRPGFESRHYKKKSSGSGTGFTQPREYN
jgi:hypothetical protein